MARIVSTRQQDLLQKGRRANKFPHHPWRLLHLSANAFSMASTCLICCHPQVAKSIQMAMGLHDDDVAFFLAADEPATYVQVGVTHHS
jgi:hypothetical protein